MWIGRSHNRGEQFDALPAILVSTVTNLERNVMLNPVKVSNTSSGEQNMLLSEIDHLDEQLFLRFKSKFIVHPSLSRLLVSRLHQDSF